MSIYPTFDVNGRLPDAEAFSLNHHFIDSISTEVPNAFHSLHSHNP